MKKLISLVLALVLCVVAMPVMAFADTATTDNLFGVIVDADGNIVERIPMPRSVFVNSVLTLPAGGKFISYQYEPNSFHFGFSTKDTDGNYITTSSPSLRIIIEGSNEIGAGNRSECVNKPISINSSRKTQGHIESVYSDDASYRYYNGKLINESSTSATVRVIVAINLSVDDLYQIGEL